MAPSERGPLELERGQVGGGDRTSEILAPQRGELTAGLRRRTITASPAIELNNWRRREWHPALEAAGLRQRGPYRLRHTFATEALAAGVSIFELARVMGASVRTIDRHYGHLARDSEGAIRARLNARSARSGDVVATGEGD